MKKFLQFFVLSLILTACANSYTQNNSHKKFVNPLFGQELKPLNKTVGHAYLTPTSVEFRGVTDKDVIIYKGQCNLVENKQDRITLKCEGEWLLDGSKSKKYYTFVIKEDPFLKHLYVLEYAYPNSEELPALEADEMTSGRYYIDIDKDMLPKNMLPKSD